MLQILWNGLVQGAVYAVVALGYTMVYGILQLINFAHGEILMVGAFTGVVTLSGCAGSGAMDSVGFAPCLAASLLLAAAVSAAYGFTVERAAYRPLRGASALSPLISAIGVSVVLQNFVMVAQGSTAVSPPLGNERYAAALGSFHAGVVTVRNVEVLILAVSAALMAGLWLLVQRTRMGTAMRATSQDRVMAGLVGIDVHRVISATFVIGSALAAVAGVLYALFSKEAKFDMGFLPGMKAFTAAVLGGIGNLPGAMVGGLLLGLAEAFGSRYLSSDYEQVYAFVVLLVVLVVRPKGILGERVAEKV